MASPIPFSSRTPEPAEPREPLTPAMVEEAAPRVTLRNAFAQPFDSAIAAARTCYAPRLITARRRSPKSSAPRSAPPRSYSGHHTVYQHAHFEFGLENVSRQFVWSFLHAHPFYNSEQQSQRYVRNDRALVHVPDMSNLFGATEIYKQAVARAWDAYRELTALLKDDARDILSDIWRVERDVAPEARRKGGAASRKARHRSGALRLAGGCGDHHGAHALRHRPAPPLADAGRRRTRPPRRAR